MRTFVLALTALALAPVSAAETFCTAEKHGDHWDVSSGSKSYSLKTNVFFVLPDGAKVRFADFNEMMGYGYVTGGDAEFNYRSDGDIYFRTAALAVNTGEKWVSVAEVLKVQGKPYVVAFREPGGEVFAYTGLGDQMAGQHPTQFGILKADQASELHGYLESGKPFDVLLATSDAVLAEVPGFVFPDFPAGKSTAESTFAEMKAQAAAGGCM